MRLLHKLSLLIQVGSEIEKVRTVGKERMPFVLFREDDILCRNAPVYAERRVVPGDGRLGLGSIVIVALVLEHRMLRKDAETMCEAPRDEKLPVAVGIQFDRNMAAESRAAATDVNGYVQYGALDYPYQFALAESPFLEMEATDYAV